MNNNRFDESEPMEVHAESLDRLFELWRAAHAAEESESLANTLPKCHCCGRYPDEMENYKKKFITDGVTSLKGNESNSEPKVDVLFILKEANTDGKSGAEESFWFNETVEATHSGDKSKRSYNTRQNYAKKFKAVLEALKIPNADRCKFGYMNLNKRGGFAGTTRSQLTEYTKKYKCFIRRQIELHDPKIIVFCGCYDRIAKIIFEKDTNGKEIEEWHKRSKSVTVRLGENDIALYYVYHPAYSGFGKSLSIFNE